MSEIELCHWILLEPTGNCRNVIAPHGDGFEDYMRVGASASSPQFVFPLAFAVRKPADLIPSFPGDATHGLHFFLHRDDKNQPGPAFSDMDPIKVVMLVSELSKSIAQWVQAVGCDFLALQIDDSNELGMKLTYNLEVSSTALESMRASSLIRTGLKMMAFARGLKYVDDLELAIALLQKSG